MRYYASQKRTYQLEAGVGVHFDQPGQKLSVNHEIKAEYFEVVLISLRGDLDKGTPDGISPDRFHFGQNLLLEAVLFLRMIGVQVFLKL